MREYETVFITQPSLSDAQQKQIVEKLKGLIERHEGRVFFARNMGKKNLAYPIAKQKKGDYTCLDYAANGTAVGDLEHNMRLDENVLRFLTVVKAMEIDVEARAAEIAARGEDADRPPAEEASAKTGEADIDEAAGDLITDNSEEE